MLNVMAHEAEPRWVRDAPRRARYREPLSAFFIASRAAYSTLVRALDMARSHAREDASCCAFRIGGTATVATRNLAATFGRGLSSPAPRRRRGRRGRAELHAEGARAWRASTVRLIAIDLPPSPAGGKNFGREDTTQKSFAWDGWLRRKMERMVWLTMVQWPEAADEYKWFAFVDADTWIDAAAATRMLAFYDCEAPVAVGRLHRATTRVGSVQVFLGGGAGIFVSRGALAALRARWDQAWRCSTRRRGRARAPRGRRVGLCPQLAGVAQLDDPWLQGFPANTLPPRCAPPPSRPTAARASTTRRTPVRATATTRATRATGATRAAARRPRT